VLLSAIVIVSLVLAALPRAAGPTAQAQAPNPLIPPLAPAAPRQDDGSVVVRTSVHNAVSPPVRELARQAQSRPAPVPPGVQHGHRPPATPRPGEQRATPVPATPAPAIPLPAAPRGAAAPIVLSTPIVSFEGLTSAQSGNDTPSDPSGAAGPNHYLNLVNVAFQVFSKTGQPLTQPMRTNSLFSNFTPPPSEPDAEFCKTTNQGDGTVLYDTLAGRFVLSYFAFRGNGDNPPYYQCVAVSQTSDPTGSWYTYAFLASNEFFNDYGKLGVWPNAYFVTSNPGGLGNGDGVIVQAFEREKMLQGLPARQVVHRVAQGNEGSRSPFGGTMFLPATLDGFNPPPVGSPNYMFEYVDDNLGFDPPDRIHIWAAHVDWSEPQNSRVDRIQTLFPTAFNTNLCEASFNCVPQPNVSQRVDTISYGYIMYRLAYRNFGTYESMVVDYTVDVGAGTGEPAPQRAGVRWYELRKSEQPGACASASPAGQWCIYQQGDWTLADTSWRWVGSIAQDASGNIAMGYSLGGPNTYPSVAYTGRGPSDPLGTFSQGEMILQQGHGSQVGSNRWGDYSMLTLDPTDDCTFWYVNNYFPSQEAGNNTNWHTRIGSFRFQTCVTPSTPTPTATRTLTPTATATPTPQGPLGPGDILVADPSAASGAGAVIRVNPTTGVQSVVTSGGPLREPVAIAATTNRAYVADPAANGGIGGVVQVNLDGSAPSLLASGGLLVDPRGITLGPPGTLYVSDAGGFGANAGGPLQPPSIIAVDATTGAQTLIAQGGPLQQPLGLVLGSSGLLYVADAGRDGAPGSIISVNPITGAQAVVSSGDLLVDPSGVVRRPAATCWWWTRMPATARVR
jgi:hypothetical protein